MREAVMRVAALEEALDHALLERPPHAAPQRARAWVARAVDTSTRRRLIAIGASPLLPHRRDIARRAPPTLLRADHSAHWTVVRIAVGAIVKWRLKVAVANKKPRHSFEPGVFRLKMAWR